MKNKAKFGIVAILGMVVFLSLIIPMVLIPVQGLCSEGGPGAPVVRADRYTPDPVTPQCGGGGGGGGGTPYSFYLNYIYAAHEHDNGLSAGDFYVVLTVNGVSDGSGQYDLSAGQSVYPGEYFFTRTLSSPTVSMTIKLMEADDFLHGGDDQIAVWSGTVNLYLYNAVSLTENGNGCKTIISWG